MAPEYFFKRGYFLFNFVAKFPQRSFNGSNCFVDTQFVYSIGRNVDEALNLVKNNYTSLGVKCHSIEQVMPITTTNDDLKRLASPSSTLGFSDGVYVKMPAAKEVLILMDSEEDAPENLPSIIKQVASERNLSVAELETQLEPFI
ncbi:hypothetical protein [Alteromonas gracilis]|uniref:hypothetical protein n=1 Tax=Alteromonas gracilis TaxID=1479524 RepID=UPI003737054B